jgi:aminoglycoside phosphotransferase (APT) family kinase protein
MIELTQQQKEQMVCDLVRSLYQTSCRIVQMPTGTTNEVFECRTPSGALIVQLHTDLARSHLFSWEKSVLERIARHGISVPNIEYAGAGDIPFAYMVYPKLEGIPGTKFTGDPLVVWRNLGECARRIHAIPASGYGRLRYWMEHVPETYPTWGAFIDSELDRFFDSTLFVEEAPPFMQRVASELRERLTAIREWDFPPRIIHGDFGLHNVLVSEHGDITGVFDWDEMTFARAPEWEFGYMWSWLSDWPGAWSRITPAQWDAFLAGYGMSPEAFENRRWDIDAVSLFRLTEVIPFFASSRDTWRLSEAQDKFTRIWNRS